MPLHRLLSLFQRRGRSGSPDPSQDEARLRIEISDLQASLAGIGTEREALDRAASLGRRDLIPDTLRGPWPAPSGTMRCQEASLQEIAPPAPERAALEAHGAHLRAMVAVAMAERQIFVQLLETLRPGMAWEEAGERLRGLCQKPFELSGFYLARVDGTVGLIRFPYFYEAGRPGGAEPIPLDASCGLTGWALFEGIPCCLESRDACEAHGMRLTEAERRSGLHTQSWFGVPLASPDPQSPRGLMAFHCYHPGAFSPDRQRTLTTLARITGLHLD